MRRAPAARRPGLSHPVCIEWWRLRSSRELVLIFVTAPPKHDGAKHHVGDARDVEGWERRIEREQLEASTRHSAHTLHDVTVVEPARDDHGIARDVETQPDDDHITRVHEGLHALARDFEGEMSPAR